MEINWIQCVLIGCWTSICITGMLTGTYLTRCLVMSAGVGVILGDIQTGLLMGAAGEMAFLGFGVSSGGSVPPNPVGPGIIGTIIAITMKEKGVDTGAALAYSFPFAVLIQFLITGIYTAATGLVSRAEQAVEKGQYGRFRLLANSTLILFMMAGFGIGFFAAYHVEGMERLISVIPGWLTAGLGTAGKMLPAVGFAVILNVMVCRDVIPFLIIGYVMAAYLKLPVLAVALTAAAIAWMLWEAEEKARVREGSRQAESGNHSRMPDKLTKETRNERDEGKPDLEEKDIPSLVLPERELRRISRKTALRAYFLQNGYNYGNYEGLSYANILFPALRRVCPDEKIFRQELKESMGYCSVNPNFLPVLTSIHLVTMNRGIAGRESRDIRVALMGPLAGIGDSLVQFCIAPVFSTIGAAMARQGMAAGPVVFLLGMNGLLLGLKLFSENLGYSLGESLAGKLREHLDSLSKAARSVGAAVIVGLAVSCVDIRMALAFGSGGVEGFNMQEFLDLLLPGALPVVYTGLLFYLIRVKAWSMYRLVGMTLGIGILLQAAGVLA